MSLYEAPKVSPEVAGQIAHCVNNPLAIIQANLLQIQRHPDDNKAAQRLERALEAVSRIAEFVKEVSNKAYNKTKENEHV